MVQEGQAVSRGQALALLDEYHTQQQYIAWLKQKVATAQDQIASEQRVKQARLNQALIRHERAETSDYQEMKAYKYQIKTLSAELDFQAGEMAGLSPILNSARTVTC